MRAIIPIMLFEIRNGELWNLNYDFNTNEYVWSKSNPEGWG